MSSLYFNIKSVGKFYFYLIVVIKLPQRGGRFFFINKFVKVRTLKHRNIFFLREKSYARRRLEKEILNNVCNYRINAFLES